MQGIIKGAVIGLAIMWSAVGLVVGLNALQDAYGPAVAMLTAFSGIAVCFGGYFGWAARR